jgi:hypothetical protein
MPQENRPPQREVSFLLGWKAGEQLSRYEKRRRLPPLQTALACEVVFGIPSFRTLCRDARLVEARYRSESGQARRALRKLSWLSEQHGRAVSPKS